MIPVLAATILLQTRSGFVAGKYELADRLKQLDVAWAQNRDTKRRREAVESIKDGVENYLNNKYSESSRALDEAIAALEDRSVGPADAVNVRLLNPFVEPGSLATLQFTWAYQPTSVNSVTVEVGNKTLNLHPLQNGTLEVNPQDLNAELKLDPEVGFLMPLTIGSRHRHVYVSLVKNATQRIAALAGSTNSDAKELGAFLQGIVQKPTSMEVELPLIQYLFNGEQLDEGRLKISDLEQVYLGKYGGTQFRAAFPKSLRGDANRGKDANVVIALHGAGGSENTFFESYGRGSAVTEALDRGWVFMSPKAGEKSMQDCIDWLIKVRGLKIRNLFVMGHSSGGGLALMSSELNPKASATAVFAPAMGHVPKSALNGPLYCAVGREDIESFYESTKALARELSSHDDFKFQEFDPAEHLMVVADAIPEAYAFFERYVH